MKEFNLKFKHLNAKVKVVHDKSAADFMCVIIFPESYVVKVPQYDHSCYAIASDINRACELAALRFKESFAALDKDLHLITKEDYFICKGIFRTLVPRIVGDTEFEFQIDKECYSFAHIINGDLYHVSQFMDYGQLDTRLPLMLMNFEVFDLVRHYGFNDSFIGKLLDKYNKVKTRHLRMYSSGVKMDGTPTLSPDRISNRVRNQADLFRILMDAKSQIKKQ